MRCQKTLFWIYFFGSIRLKETRENKLNYDRKTEGRGAFTSKRGRTHTRGAQAFFAIM